MFPGCRNKTDSGGYCRLHVAKQHRKKDARPSSAERGYNATWQKIREEVLRAAGISKADWHLYDVHHEPNYNPLIEPDHRKYKLTPILHGVHSLITGRNKKG